MIGLVDRNDSDPSIYSDFNQNRGQYWSSDDYLASSADDAWSVRFTDGSTGAPLKTSELYVRCVHSSGDTVDTVDYARDDLKEIVLDTSTNLMWQDTAQSIGDENKKTWSDAVNQCENLELDDKSDWRLPSLSELDSITDKSRFGPAINPEFKNADSSHVWSSTGNIDNSAEAWYTFFWCGCNDVEDKGNEYNVRCVRTIN